MNRKTLLLFFGILVVYQTIVFYFYLTFSNLEEPHQEVIDSKWDWPSHHFEEAGIPLNINDLKTLPTTQELINFVGESPVIVDGADSSNDQCSKFRQSVHERDRWIGVAGLFNTGTNLLYELLDQNCILPGEEKRSSWEVPVHLPWGKDKKKRRIQWQVPWGKHNFADWSVNHTATTFKNVNINRDHGLTIVSARDPYEWSKSMCRNPYIVEWDDEDPSSSSCPNLTSAVHAWGTHKNLMHFWNLWYRKYMDYFPHSKIIVRIEDLTLRPQETIKQVCSCAGGQVGNRFKHVVGSAKTGPGHENKSTGMVKAWSRFRWPRETRGGLSIESYKIAKGSIDEDLMGMFGYKHPPAS